MYSIFSAELTYAHQYKVRRQADLARMARAADSSRPFGRRVRWRRLRTPMATRLTAQTTVSSSSPDAHLAWSVNRR